MRFFTSDLHIGDKTIARWRGFGQEVAAHDAMVLSRLAARLGEDDELWILGDICKPTVAMARSVREAIPAGRVHVVIGNHDTGSKFRTAGGYVSVDYYDQVGKERRDGYKFVMSHYPMLDWDRAYHGSYMLHGHIHSLPLARPGEQGLPFPADHDESGFGMRGYNEWCRSYGVRRYDVGVDANGYRPVTAEEIVDFFTV